MSENNDYCQLATTTVVSSPSTNNNTRQFFVPISSEFSILHNESFTPLFCAPPIVTDVCVGSQNGVRNTSTTTKTRENELPIDDQKYSFTLSEKRSFINHSMSEDSKRTVKPQFYIFDIPSQEEENLRPSINAQFSDNHRDTDTISDAGTYIIEEDESEQKTNPSSLSAFKRYGDQTDNRRGTFDIRGLISSTTHTIHRPTVDSNIPGDDLLWSPSSSNSSVHSFNGDESISENKSYSQKQIKPAEAFVISPAVETKSFPTTNVSRPNVEIPSKSKAPTKSVSSKDPNPGNITTQTITAPHSARSNQNSSQLQKQPLSLKPSIRPHTATNDQPSSFQRNSNPQHQRQTVSSLSTIDNDETTPHITKVYGNKSFLLRQQHSNLAPTISKPSSRQPLKSLPSAPTSATSSNSQSNRAVELRRARAQAKIEELSQRTKKQPQKSNHSTDIMSASWHSNASTTNKKDLTNLRTTIKTNVAPKQQDMLTTRTISSSVYHRSSSASPNPLGERHEQKHQKMSTSTYNTEEDRCDSLRDNGQRLAIKLIQLSSGILEKLKPNDDVSVRELEKLVHKLQTVNRTLTSIDASLTGPTNDDAFH